MKKITRNAQGFFNISFILNSKDFSVAVSPKETLLDLIRRLGYKGTKRGCDSGDCGSCAIIMNSVAVVSCVLPALYADGKEIITIEGLGDVSNPHPIQSAFVEAGAVQCGFCIPGMIMTTKFLLDRIENPDEKTIKHYLDGNLCRCTGYIKQVNAVKLASSKLKNIKNRKWR